MNVWVVAEAEVRSLVTRALGQGGHAVHGFGSVDAMLDALERRRRQPDVVLIVGPRTDLPEVRGGPPMVALSESDALDPRRLKRLVAGREEIDLISEGAIGEALAIRRDGGGSLGEILVEMGEVSEQEMLFVLAAQAGMEVVDLDDWSIPQLAIDQLDATTAQRYQVMPIDLTDGELTVAMADPLDADSLADLRLIAPEVEIVGAVASPAQIRAAIARCYGDPPRR